jgi:hypothetical protein
MAEANMNCMIINVWVHHMQVDELFDFLNMRINAAPYYWLNEASVPTSITGGYVMISLTYDSYSHLSSNRNWDEAPGWINQ